MERQMAVYAIYPTSKAAEQAADELLANGCAKEDISVLCPKNKNTRDFAAKKGTHAPKGTDHGRYADVPLNGTLGFLKPGEGPLLGALHDALIDMSVPEDWCHHRVVHGKFLISVLTRTHEELLRTLGIFMFTGANDVSWSIPRRKYWERAAG
jgi:hypothetical protein